MKPNELSIKLAAFIILIFSIDCQFSKAQVITYKVPQGIALNDDFSVKVRQKGKEWQPLAIYLARIVKTVGLAGKMNGENSSFAYFDFSGEVEVAVTYNKGAIKEARVRPFSSIPKVTGNTMVFSLAEPKNLSIEVNGDVLHNLQLFANGLETCHRSQKDTSVIYYGPGIHHADSVILKSNQTVYIAGGAVVMGSFKLYHVKNVKIEGHGIIDHSSGPIDIGYSQNITVDGIIMLNPRHNTATIGESDQVTIRNIKSFSDQQWGDGIDVFCSSNVLIDGVFMRNSDDCVAIYAHRGRWYGSTKHITVQNSALWADVAHPIVVGTHGDPLHPDTLGDLKFINIDILDQHEKQIDYQGCIALNAGDDNLIRNVYMEDIRIDDFRTGQFINMRVMYNHKYNTAAGRGIENVYIKNMSCKGTNANMAVITGYDETRAIKNVVFENLTINGKVIWDKMPDKPYWYKTGDMANIFVGEHVEGLSFIESEK